MEIDTELQQLEAYLEEPAEWVIRAARPIEFVHLDDGWHLTAPWPAFTVVDDRFMAEASPHIVTRDGDRVRFRMNNCEQEYSIIGRHPLTDALVLERKVVA